MQLINRIRDWTRVEWLWLGAMGALLLGIVVPWYVIPQDTLEAFSASLWLPQSMRLVSLLALVVVARMLWAGSATSRQRLMLWAALGVSLLFPFLMSFFSPTASFLSSAFDLQRESVANHIETNFPNIQSRWKQSIKIDPYNEARRYAPELIGRSVPNPLRTLPNERPFQIDDGKFFQASSWDWLILEGLNYNAGFMGSIAKGWPFTVAALVTALIACYLFSLETLYSDAARLAPWFLAGSVGVLFLILVPSFADRRVTILQAQGRYSEAASLAKLAYTCSPPLWGDTAFSTRMAECCFRANQESSVPIQFARGVECWGVNRLNDARTYFEKALAAAPENFLIRGYLSATLMRIGAECFDKGQPAAAEVYFREVLDHFPDHIQATYYFMLAKAVNSDFKGSALVADRLRELDKTFQLAGIATIGQAHLHNAWAVYREGNLDQAWQTYQKSVDRSTWE